MQKQLKVLSKSHKQKQKKETFIHFFDNMSVYDVPDIFSHACGCTNHHKYMYCHARLILFKCMRYLPSSVKAPSLPSCVCLHYFKV